MNIYYHPKMNIIVNGPFWQKRDTGELHYYLYTETKSAFIFIDITEKWLDGWEYIGEL